MSLYTTSKTVVPQSSDINQLVGALTSQVDAGEVSYLSPLSAPSSAPAASVSTTSGNPNGTYQYVVTYITGVVESYTRTVHVTGETLPSAASSSVTTSGAYEINVTIPVGPTGTIGRRLYRTQSGGSTFLFDQEIDDNTTTQVVDNIADNSLGVAAPTQNTTGTWLKIGNITLGNTSGSSAWVSPAGAAALASSLTAQTLSPTGLPGATAASSYVGATASGAPTTGTFAVGDFVIDQSGAVWVCTAAGSPGTWTKTGPNVATTTTAGTVETAVSPSSGTPEAIIANPSGAQTLSGSLNISGTLTSSGNASVGGGLIVTSLLTASGGVSLPSVTPSTSSGVVTQQNNQLFIGNGSSASPVGSNPLTSPYTYALAY